MFAWARSLFGGSGKPAAAGYYAGLKAGYDNARTHDENKRLWWGADYLSAKSANSFAVRRTLRMRSRNEVANNPYLFGIVTNNADDLIGADGPTLKVLTTDAGYNRRVEQSWRAWWDEVSGVEKLRTLKLAKTVDGEGFLVLKTVNDLEHPVKLYPVDVEADQVTTPAPVSLTDFAVDGLTLHPVTGRPTAYRILRQHPGDLFAIDLNPLAADTVRARHVIHWFNKFRPGQVRGVPVFTPALDLFTELRAYRRAVLGAAEIAADFAALLQQDRANGADDDADTEYQPFKKVGIERKMMTMLPPGVTASQLKAEHPTTTYEMFHEKCLGEACRPLAYPLNLALGTSQKFNFSSSKLDIVNYRSGLTVERKDGEAVALNRLFAPWFEEAVLTGAVPATFGLAVPSHEWHWPGFEPLDPVADAEADHQRLAKGTAFFQEFWSKRGRDWREVMAQQAAEKAEIDRLGLEFGEPTKHTVTEAIADPEAANVP